MRKHFAIATQKINIDLDDGVLVPIKGLEKEEDYLMVDSNCPLVIPYRVFNKPIN